MDVVSDYRKTRLRPHDGYTVKMVTWRISAPPIKGMNMHIKERLNQTRRDFKALFECEFCGHTMVEWGYDDRHFHENVIPAMECPECGKANGKQTSTIIVPEGIEL